MNADADSSNSSIYYYDGDYPSPELSVFPENFDEVTKYQGLAFDVVRYKEIAAEQGGPVLELCCGTGRVSIPLAGDGFRVTGVTETCFATGFTNLSHFIRLFRRTYSLSPSRFSRTGKIEKAS
jgi:AraC-like DNA-binding protein